MLFCNHTISQSTAYIGDSVDLEDFLNDLVEMKPEIKQTEIKLIGKILK